MILITSAGELLLYFTVIFFSFHKKNSATGLFLCAIIILQDYIFRGFEL